MDRREALKKLAAGSAVAFASPLILKSTAFADSGTASCLPSPFPNPNAVLAGTINVVSDTGYPRLVLPNNTAAFTSIVCPAGFEKFDQYRWSPVSGPVAFAVINNNLAAPNPDATDRWVRARNVRIYESPTATGLTTPGEYTLLLQIRIACRTTTRVCWRCTGVQISVTWDGTAVTASSVTATTSAPNCDSPQPPLQSPTP